ncbi:L,D-transpeptidase family protein [Rhodoblastus sp.]|uniref:L,D-transpeptidase family protein n=1 Tax=Rhodoblastus sp. TaxID=1962975 RepID=UPI003F9D3BD3
MKHRKWARFLGLSVASAASLCLGAFLSYEAAMQQGPASEPAIQAAAGQGAVAPAAVAQIAAAQTPASPLPQKLAEQTPVSQAEPAPISTPVPTSAPSSGPIVASLDSDAPPVFSVATALNMPSDPRGDADAGPIQASLPSADAATANPEPLPPEPEQAATGDDLFHGKPAPLPPSRPTSSAGNLPPTPPIPGQGPAPVVSAPASAPQQAGLSSFANALAAITSSVGGANSALSPAETEPTPPQVAAGGFKMGAPVYIRIFKKESVLELWMKRGGSYALYKSFPVCRWSGGLGPKLRYADYQSPEGFYEISAHQLNPHSHYHLALNLGYPNAYDRRHGATGDAVMIHGDCKSVGCFAMTDAGIDQIYPIVAAALRDGEREVPVHIFPFRMTDQAIARVSAPPSALLSFLSQENARPHRDWSAFWHNLKEGYDLFERTHEPPMAYACGDRYEFGDAGRSCTRIAGW